MATPSHFLNQIKSFFKIKIELAIEWETHESEMQGPQIGMEFGFLGTNQIFVNFSLFLPFIITKASLLIFIILGVQLGVG